MDVVICERMAGVVACGKLDGGSDNSHALLAALRCIQWPETCDDPAQEQEEAGHGGLNYGRLSSSSPANSSISSEHAHLGRVVCCAGIGFPMVRWSRGVQIHQSRL